jgi:hypothetical protein
MVRVQAGISAYSRNRHGRRQCVRTNQASHKLSERCPDPIPDPMMASLPLIDPLMAIDLDRRILKFDSESGCVDNV